MRFLAMVKADKDYEAGLPPSQELMAAMGALTEEMTKAGVIVASEGLQPSSQGKRVKLSGGKVVVTDGPFAETKEIVGGFAILKADSMEEVMKLNDRFIDAHVQAGIKELDVEIRPLEEFLPCGAEQVPKHKSQIFVNLPVKDLPRSMEFFKSLGYTFNPQFTDENAACMVISDDIYAMLLTEKFFATFTPKKVANASQTTEVLNALSLPTRAAVDELVNKALAAGAKRYCEPKDHGFMYQWGFEDLDGHIWEYLWMDPSFAQK
jgi:uncharacterized protein